MSFISKNKYLLYNVVIQLISIVVFFRNCWQFSFIQDDAFTTLRYVENFVHGNGLVFNIGERVEGYTNFLWVIILSFAKILDFNIVIATQFLSILFGLATLIILVFLSKVIFDKLGIPKKTSELFSSVPSLILSLTGGFIYWSVSGMETTLFLSLIFLSFFFYFKKKNSFLFIYPLIFASLTRPEGMYILGLIILHKLFLLFIEKNFSKNNLQKLISGLIPYFIIIGGYSIFRLYYYGYPFPNTFYVKAGFSWRSLELGLQYFQDTFTTYGIFGLLILIPLVLQLKKIKSFEASFFVIIVLFFTVAVTIIGGDVLPLHRFYLPVLPLYYIYFIGLIFVIIEKINATKIIPQISFVVTIVLFYFFLFTKEVPSIYNWRGFELGLVDKMNIYADWVKENDIHNKKKSTVALSTIGAFSYYSGTDVIDLIGLTDEYVAHNPKEIRGLADSVDVLWKERNYNADYILSRKPDYILFPAGAKPTAYPEAAVFSRTEFLLNYYPQLIYAEKYNQYLPIFSRKSDKWVEAVDMNKCSVGFVGNYINANKYFIKLNENNSDELEMKINSECESMIKNCELSKTYAYSVLGYMYFHLGELDKAENYLLKSVQADEMNCIALSYLMILYHDQGNNSESMKYQNLLKKFSPSSLPSFFN